MIMYGIYANIGGILMVNVAIYMPYMDPPRKWALLIQGAANPGAGSRSAAAQDEMIGSTVAR